jgi:hypothetical protein
MSFAPLGEVVSGMAVADSLFNKYGEGPPGGHGPDQGELRAQGNTYLRQHYALLDSIVTAKISQEWKKDK